MYMLFVFTLFVGFCFLVLIGIWGIAKADTIYLFGFIKEGQGTFRMHGERAGEPLIALRGHICIPQEETKHDYDQKGNVVGTRVLTREKIIPGEQEYAPGLLGFLEKSFGIYWLGFPPLNTRMEKKFRWNEWKQIAAENGKVTAIELIRREEKTKFFYVQTFPYALKLKEAETGSTMKNKDGTEIGGNVSVDLDITLLLRIIYPRVALFDNQDWFDQLGDTVLANARKYVGTHSYEELRAQMKPEFLYVVGAANVPKEISVSRDEFCERVMSLNEWVPIGKNSDSVIDTFGVEIIGALITSVELAGESKLLAGETTKIYVAQQEAGAKKIIADAEAYTITATGDAKATALAAGISAMKAGATMGDSLYGKTPSQKQVKALVTP